MVKYHQNQHQGSNLNKVARHHKIGIKTQQSCTKYHAIGIKKFKLNKLAKYHKIGTKSHTKQSCKTSHKMVIKNPIKQGYQISFNCDQELSLTKTIKCHKIVIKDQI